MEFEYQARTKTGEIQIGVIEAISKEAALSLLQKSGLIVTKLEPVSVPFYAKRIKLFRRISKREIALFSRQLSIMVKSKVSLIEALRALAVQIKNPDFKEIIFEIANKIEGGEPFSKALSHYPKVFNPFYVNMIKAGEVSGKLSESLEYLANHLEREYYFTSQVKGAMIYPLLVISVVFIVMGIMVFFVVPKIASILETSVAELPFLTRMVLSFTNFLKKWGWLLLFVFSLLVIYLYSFSKTEKGKDKLNKILLDLPLIGEFLKKIYLARFAENLSTLISGGLPIAQALHITGEVVGNSLYKKAIFEARDGTRKGEQISTILEGYVELFPPLVIQMIKVGEKTGTLEKTLKNVVEFYQKETDIFLKTILKILEPALVIFLAFIVGLLVASTILPLYQITTLF